MTRESELSREKDLNAKVALEREKILKELDRLGERLRLETEERKRRELEVDKLKAEIREQAK